MRIALGFTIKSGWACAVALGGAVAAPEVLDCRRVELSDPRDGNGRQPYHAAAGTARKPGPRLDTLLASIETFGRQSVGEFIRQHETRRGSIAGAGIVVGSLIDPATIGNDHIRIHALEGQLFRTIVKDAAERRHVPASVWRERDLYALAAAQLKRTESDLRQALAGIGRTREGSWRAEHKSATLAAWLVLAAPGRPAATPPAVFK
jgi:hypothetical protein